MIDWVHAELLAWGEWAARVDDRKGDYPDHAAFTESPTDSAWYHRDAPFERVPDDFERINRCVQLLHPERLRIVVIHLYKHGYRIRRTAAAMLVDKVTVQNYRDRAHITIGRMISEGLDNRVGTSP